MPSILDAMNKVFNNTRTWNGAISNTTTSLDKCGACLDYFAKAGTYTNRSQELVNADMVKIFGDDTETALKIVFGLRLITRKTNLPEDFPIAIDITETQTGYGRRDEFYKAIVWLHNNKPRLLYSNLHLIPLFGSWKDFLNEPLISVLDRSQVFKLFRDNFDDNLLRKYLPQIRSNRKLRSDRDKLRSRWAKELCEYLHISWQDYRKWKTEGAGHIWQKQMSSSQWDSINFNGIPGKAMFLHTTRRNKKDKKTVWERHGQVERLVKWLEKQPTVKFTGYPYELYKKASDLISKTLYTSEDHKPLNILEKMTLDKQFNGILKSFGKHKLGNVLCALDTSGSMSSDVMPGVKAIDICCSMGLVLSSLNMGYFKDTVVAFSATSKLIKLRGDSFCDRVQQIQPNWMGNTNFQSVIDCLVDTRVKNPGIPVSDYPETLLVLSDMQFDPAGNSSFSSNRQFYNFFTQRVEYNNVPEFVDEKTNYEVAMEKLRAVGLGNMRIIWWHLNGAAKDFPAEMNDKGVYMISGFDPVNLKALMGLDTVKKDFKAKEKQEETPLDGMMNFIGQHIFSLIEVDSH